MNEALSTLLSFQQGTTTGAVANGDEVKLKCCGTWPWHLRNSYQPNETLVTENTVCLAVYTN
jgi:hypothetical protein